MEAGVSSLDSTSDPFLQPRASYCQADIWPVFTIWKCFHTGWIKHLSRAPPASRVTALPGPLLPRRVPLANSLQGVLWAVSHPASGTLCQRTLSICYDFWAPFM